MTTLDYLDALHLGGLEFVLIAAVVWLGVLVIAEARAGTC